MNTVFAVFASSKYWKNTVELTDAVEQMKRLFPEQYNRFALITEEADLLQFEAGGDCLVIIPMSGAVQGNILKAAQLYKTIVLYPAYIHGNATNPLESKMLEYNAAPACMDCWAVLKRTHAHSLFALNARQLEKTLRVYRAYLSMQGAAILLIGDTEPWVVSNSADHKCYERLGVKVKRIEQAEVANAYRCMPDEAASPFYHYFMGSECKTLEPTNEEIKASCRMAAALMQVADCHKADAIALACFNLLAEGTNCCLGVSYINDCTQYAAACEGDVDSAITMLAMKHIARTKLWMANPGLHPDGTINFSHCTAPLNINGDGKCRYMLRNHHESGIGTSVQAEYPIGSTVTACRISDDAKKMTVQKGVTIAGPYENACRTQVYVQFDNFTRYIETVLGCHQVFAFEDITDEMRMLGAQLGLDIL